MMILALALSLSLALVIIAADSDLRSRLGDAYWVVSLAIIGSILLVLAGYVWDRTLMDRVRQINETTKQQTDLAQTVAPALGTPDELSSGGEPDEIMGLARQIERMAQALQKIEASYRGVVEDQVDLICRYRADGCLSFVNGATSRFLGKKRHELIGQRLPFLDLGQPRRDFQGHWPELATFELDLVDSEGRPATYSWTHRAIKGSSGEVLEYQAVGHDITTRKEAEAALHRAKEAAESADRAKSEFLATVSQEIRTPISGVIEHAKHLRETPLREDQRDYVELIHSHGLTLESLVADILDLSRMEAGQIDIEHKPFVLRDCLNEVHSRFLPKARANTIDFEVRIDPGVPPVIHGDVVRLKQILTNLVGNALKFTERGSVSVSVTCIRGDDILGSDRRRVRLFFAITDTGIGIPAERLAELFKPFSQVKIAELADRGGTGLGLIICKRLCEMMGGAISVESRWGEGSTFRFSLALDYQKPDPATAASLEAAPTRLLHHPTPS